MKELMAKLSGGKMSPVALLILIVLFAGAIYFVHYTGTAATLLFAAWVMYKLSPGGIILPPPQEIAVAAGAFLESAANTLQDRLLIFRDLYYDKIPVAGETKEYRFPRWEWRLRNQCGLTLIQLGFFRASASYLSKDTLAGECRVLQGLLAMEIKSGKYDLAVFPTVEDGLPVLHLLNIVEDGNWRIFNFVLIDSEETAERVHRYDLPPAGGDGADKDF